MATSTRLRFLLDRKADPNAADSNGRAALFAAVDMRDIYQSNRPAPSDNGKVEPMDPDQNAARSWSRSQR